MNQPRYSDNYNNYPGNNVRQRSIHGSSRSNYGGGGGGGGGGAGAGVRNTNNSNNGGGRGNPNTNNRPPLGQVIGNWISSRNRRRLHQQQRTNNNNNNNNNNGRGGRTTTTTPVGTEANAIQNMARNALHFSYPPAGFVTPIEYSLLYAMIEFPERYPEQVVKHEIEDEEFDAYLHVKEDPTKRNKGARARSRDDDDNDDLGRGRGAGRGGNNYDNDEDGETTVSYAQLSALLSLSSEKNPPAPPTPNGGQLPQPNPISNDNASVVSQQQLSIGQVLCRKLLKTITRYSDAHSLDRQTEIAEFLSPVERRCRARAERAALQQLLPAYAGYTLSLMTGNPLPLLIGVVALTSSDPLVEETSNNVSGFTARAGRSGQMETAGLLDECDSD